MWKSGYVEERPFRAASAAQTSPRALAPVEQARYARRTADGGCPYKEAGQYVENARAFMPSSFRSTT
jgi:hypothetical protein